jgi:maleylacetoacetate isomerase
MSSTTLYDYPKSSASYRVRIALHLAGIEYQTINVDLLDGEQKSDVHLERNPQGLVPVLNIDGQQLTQSLAILEYLNDTRGLDLLPSDPAEKALCRALAYSIAVDVHPICNLSVMRHATGGQEPERTKWMEHFIRPGLVAYEKLLERSSDKVFSVGERPSLADICLIPQLYNARRWKVDYSYLVRICAVESLCDELPAFRSARPD